MWKLLGLVFLMGIAAACGNGSSRGEETKNWMQPNGKVKVLSTVAMLNDLVRGIGGDNVDAITLIKADLDPHSYQLVKGDDEKIASADVIFFNGLGLEHGPSLKEALEHNSKALPVGNKIMEKYPDKQLHYRGQPDPHIWMDISLWVEGIPFIAEKLAEKDPAHRTEYFKNAGELKASLLKTHEIIRGKLQSIPPENRYLVTSHDAFNYFTKVYLATDKERTDGTWMERFAAPEGLAPESQLSVNDIQKIIDHLDKYRIEVMFPETTVSKDSLRKIVSAAKEKGLNVIIAGEPLYADSMGSAGSDGDTYPGMITHNAEVISKYLNKANP